MERHNKATLLSLLVMGLGQIYNKQFKKGAILILEEILVIIFGIPYFYNSLFGLRYLGVVKQWTDSSGHTHGDNSTTLLVDGVLGIIILLLVLVSYIWNVWDARNAASKIEESGFKKESAGSVLDRMFPVILLAPTVVLILFVTVVPLVSSFFVAFTDWSSPNHLTPRTLLDWVGFKNFINLFKMSIWSSTFGGVFVWTIAWAILATFTSYASGLIFALFISNKGIRFKKFWRTILILPMIVPGFVTILTMRVLFGPLGPINKFLSSTFKFTINFMGTTWITRTILIGVNLWLACGGLMLLMSGVISNLPADLYEAADLDGASAFQKFKKITLPLVLYSTGPLIIMSFASNLNNFGLILMLTGGNPTNLNYRYAGNTDILASWIYNLTMQQQQYAMGMVVSILMFIIIGLFSIFNIRNSRAFREEDNM